MLLEQRPYALPLVPEAWLPPTREGQFWLSAGLIAVLGGITLILHDKTFIMWKPTLVYLLFAGVFAATQVVGDTPLIERVLGNQLRMARAHWRRLGWAWVGFFGFCAAANAGVVQYYAHAEQALRAGAPGASAAALNDLDCAADFGGSTLALCREALAREEIWVNFKLFGLIALTVVFILAQTLWLARHATAVDDTGGNGGTEEANCSTRS